MVTSVTNGDAWNEEGRLALDFVNYEVASRIGISESFESPAPLAGWLDAARGSDLGATHALGLPDHRTLMSEARRLGSEMRRLFRAVARAEPIPAETLFTVNRAIDSGRPRSRLLVADGAPVVETVHAAETPLAMLAPIALAAAELVAHADPRRLRQCAGEDCAAWFLDTSKGGQRRWCSMARCGNRSKAARYRRRHATVE